MEATPGRQAPDIPVGRGPIDVGERATYLDDYAQVLGHCAHTFCAAATAALGRTRPHRLFRKVVIHEDRSSDFSVDSATHGCPQAEDPLTPVVGLSNGPSLSLRPFTDGDNAAAAGLAVAPVERDSLANFFPALRLLTILAAALEGAASVLLAEPYFATAAVSTAVFAVGVTVAGYQSRAGRPVRARVVLAISLTIFGAIGSYLLPGVGEATALLPVLSVILVLPYLSRKASVPIVAAAVGLAATILVLDPLAHQRPAIPGLAGTIFTDSILIGALILVLAGLTDFATAARNSLRTMRELTERQLRVTSARLSIVAALRLLHSLPTPEETAAGIAAALGDLPLVDIALVLELTDDGLMVLATAGRKPDLIHYSGPVPPSRAAYVLDRSRYGAWGELWADRPELGPEDKRLTQPGTEGQSFAPILWEGHIVGLIAIATANPDEAMHLVADLPSISEAAAVASAILAPALFARRHLSSTRVRIADIIASGAFHPVFQPIVDLRTGLTVGFEALTRFATGDEPAEIFADATRVGLGAQLEAATLTAAVRDAARLPANGWLSLNVSPIFLAECAQLTAILTHRTRPIILEITEHDIVDDYAPLHAAMRAMGPDVRLAVDDAGAGVANFEHLVNLRPDLVKIDAGLIRGVNADVSRQALIVGLVHFAAVSGALVLAEGIETQAEEETVQRLGVTLGQGFLLARPAPIEEWALATHPIQPTVSLAKVIPIVRPARLNSAG